MAQKKIDFFGQFRPTGIDQTAGMAAKALAGLAGEAQGIAFGEAKKRAISEGRQAGLEAGQQAAETGEAPEMAGSFRFRDQAYNEGAILSYRAQVQRDTKETLNKLSNEYELDPEGFRKNAEAFKKGITQGLPDEMRFVVDDDIESAITDRATRIDDNAFKHHKRQMIADNVEMVADLEDRILNAVRSGDEEKASKYRAQRMALLERGVSNGLVDPVKRAEADERLLEQITVDREIGKLDRLFADDTLNIDEKIQRATVMLDEKKNDVYKDLSPTQRDSLNNALKLKLNEQLKLEAELNAQEQKQIAQETVNLKLDAKHGRRPPEDIQSDAYKMFRDQQITESEYQGIIDQVATVQKEKTDLAILDDKVSRRISGDESIYVSQKEADSHFERNVLPLVDSLDRESRIAILSNYSSTVGVVPTALSNRIKNNLRSEDADLIAESAEIIDNLDNIRGLESPVTPHDRAFAEQVVNLSQTMSPEQALTLAREQADPRNKELIESREAIIKDEEYEEDYRSNAIDALDTSLFGVGEPEGIDDINAAQLEKEYKTLFEAHFKAGMDKDQAEAKAKQLIAKNWGFSESSGRMMKHPPESYYSVSGESDYIKDQLKDFVMNETSFGISTEGFERAFLVGDEQTSKLASRSKPDYFVYVQGKDGQLNLITGRDPSDGKIKPIRWAPDVEAERERQKKQNAEEVIKKRQQVAKDEQAAMISLGGR